MYLPFQQLPLYYFKFNLTHMNYVQSLLEIVPKMTTYSIDFELNEL